ncbi:hypothetical protein Tco_0425871 [Tanacetum coccineum]
MCLRHHHSFLRHLALTLISVFKVTSISVFKLRVLIVDCDESERLSRSQPRLAFYIASVSAAVSPISMRLNSRDDDIIRVYLCMAYVSLSWRVQYCIVVARTNVVTSSTVAGELLQEGDDVEVHCDVGKITVVTSVEEQCPRGKELLEHRFDAIVGYREKIWFGEKEKDVANLKTKRWNCGAGKKLVGEVGESSRCLYAWFLCEDGKDIGKGLGLGMGQIVF